MEVLKKPLMQAVILLVIEAVFMWSHDLVSWQYNLPLYTAGNIIAIAVYALLIGLAFCTFDSLQVARANIKLLLRKAFPVMLAAVFVIELIFRLFAVLYTRMLAHILSAGLPESALPYSRIPESFAAILKQLLIVGALLYFVNKRVYHVSSFRAAKTRRLLPTLAIFVGIAVLYCVMLQIAPTPHVGNELNGLNLLSLLNMLVDTANYQHTVNAVKIVFFTAVDMLLVITAGI